MKRLLLFWVLLSFWLSNVLAAQTFEDGMSAYKKANLANAMNKKDEEIQALEDAYRIFRGMASTSDYKSLVMDYLMSLKLRQEFTHQALLAGYIKDEHPDYPTLVELKFYGEDKNLVKDNIREIARQNEQKAGDLLDEAKKHAGLDQYEEAVIKLSEAEKLWKLEGLIDLKTKYEKLKKEKEGQRFIRKAKSLTSQRLYQDALKALDGASGLVEDSEIAALKGDIKNKWYQDEFRQARVEYNNKNYSEALSKCETALNILSTKEALKLKGKIQKRIKRGISGSYPHFSVFLDFGIASASKLNQLNYSSTDNSTYYIDLYDSGKVVSELATEDEDDPKTIIGFGGGISAMFSRSMGIMAYISSVNQEFNLFSDYTFSWTWWDDTGGNRNGSFTDTGKVSVTPISFNLLTVLKMGRAGRIKLYFGPTIFLTKLDLTTHMGYGIVEEHSSGYYYVDWFPFEYRLNKSASIFGGNIGVDLEYGVAKKVAGYLGFQYLFASKKEFNWEFVIKRYDGELGHFYISDPSWVDNGPNFKTSLNVSAFKINLGIRVYF